MTDFQTQINAARVALGARLFALAIDWSHGNPNTQAERFAAIKAARGRKMPAKQAESEVSAVSNLIRQARINRRPIRQWLAQDSACSIGRRPIVLPKGTPAERLHARRQSDIRAGLRACLRVYERASSHTLSIVDSLTACSCELKKTEGWIDYGSKSRYGIIDAQYSVAAMPRLPIPRAIDGLLTLGAIEAPALAGEGERVYAAVWAAQAKDGPSVQRGFIVARESARGTHYAHGLTASAARGTLTRRGITANQLKIDRWQQTVRAALLSGHIDGYECHVSLADASRAGLCKPGVTAWASRNFPGRDIAAGASVSEILAVKDRPEFALAACLVAIRRQKNPGA